MKLTTLIKRGLTYYWRTNLAVVVGVGVAVAVLSGALLVGVSVRGSLRELALGRLGATEHVIVSGGHFFRDALAEELRAQPDLAANGFGGACPLIAVEGALAHERSGRRSARVQVYGVDERFWQFHGQPNSLGAGGREVALSAALAAELGTATGEALLLRVEKPSAIPAEFLHGRREDAGRTLRLSMGRALDETNLGEFSLRPQQGAVHAVFVSLALLQRELDQESRVNTILLSAASAQNRASEDLAAATARAAALEHLLQKTFTPTDAGVKLRSLNQPQMLSVESDAGVISSPLATSIGPGGEELFSYLANAIRADDGRAVPYSLVTAVNRERFEMLQHDASGHVGGCGSDISDNASALPPIILNEWAANDLGAKPGARITLDYYLWLEEGRLATRAAEFRIACVVPMQGFAADRDLTPEYPGITESESLADWDPPFPVDLKRVRPQDEDYWKQYRATPKAFILLSDGQRLWQTRFGKLTSIRFAPSSGQTLAAARVALEQRLRAQLVPTRAGFSILPVRAEGLAASRGATDFGEYFLYFSFFLVVSALMLAGLFFKLGVEQRLRELGLLRAVGFPVTKIRVLFLSEGTLLALLGAALGGLLALGYSALVMLGLRTWWVEAVGTRALTLHFEPLPLIVGAVGGLLAALVFIWWTLRRVLAQDSTRGLLAGEVQPTSGGGQISKSRIFARVRPAIFSRFPFTGLVSGVLAFALIFGAWGGVIGDVVGFFGAGVLLLVSALSLLSWRLKQGAAAGRRPISGGGVWALARMGARFAAHRPGRSVLCVALVASAAFIIVAVEAFRRETPAATDRRSGTGGYAVLAEALLPIAHDPNTEAGREALNLTAGGDAFAALGVQFARFRLKPGDDASCLNLYQPQNPRILGAPTDFVRANRFSFQSSMAATEEEQNNPWLLLEKDWDGAAVPVIVDANSLTYVLHRKVGDEFTMSDDAGQSVRLRVVGALADSLFQSELVTAERHFLRAFPGQEGFRFFLLDVAQPERAGEVSGRLEESLSDYGFDAQGTVERLASFHRVENTYLSTFQTLGALGLTLGTLGLAAVLLRNVLERQRELALLRAVGYGQRHLALMVIAESALLLCAGLAIGVGAALLAVAPAFAARGGELFKASLAGLLLIVLVIGLLASLLATVVALRAPLLKALRAE